MASCYAGLYWRLKDYKTPLADRLKLMQYAWYCPRVYLPNKKQVLIDVLCGLLLHKNRKQIEGEDVGLVWSSLLQLLSSASCQFSTENSLLIKPSICQVLLDNLQNFVTKGDNSSYISQVIGCCLVIISSPALLYVITTKFDNVISLLAVVCQLCTKQSLEKEKPALFDLLGHVIRTFAKSLSAQTNQKQVLQVVVEKLVSVMMLLHVAMEKSADTVLVDITDQLKTVLESALFHKENESAFHIYLTVLYGAEDIKFQCPRIIDNIFHIFSQLVAGKIPAKCPNMSPEECKEIVSSYLPLFFKGFVKHNHNTPSFCFKMFMHICDLIGLKSSEDDDSSLTATQVVMVTDSCLQIVLESNLYVISLDNTSGRTQFAFFKKLVGYLLKLDREPLWYECLCTILQLNHGILETEMTKLLRNTWLQTEVRKDTSTSVDSFLTQLVSTYSKLHQIPRWFDFVLNTIKTNTPGLRFLLMPPAFSKRLGEVVTTLPQTTVLEVWNKLTEEVKSYLTSLSENKELDKSGNLLQVCQIYHHFLSNVKVTDYSITEMNAEKILQLMVSMETDILVPLFKIFSDNTKDVAVLNALLMLSLAHGELKLLLALHCHKHRASIETAATVSHLSDLTLVHSYLTSSEWEKIFNDVLHSKEKSVLYLLDRMLVQKVKGYLVFCENTHVMTTTVANALEMILTWLSEISSQQQNTSWNLGIDDLSDSNYGVARWNLIVENAGVLVPMMTSDQITKLAHFVLSTFEYQQISNFTEEKGVVTLRSITTKFLKDPIVMETRLLVSSIITSLWTTIRKSLSPSNSSKKNRRHSGITVAILDGLKNLENSQVVWHLPVDSDLLEHLQCAAMQVNEVLQTADVQDKFNTNNYHILHILHQLPLYYLNPGNQLQCIFGLVFIITIIFNQSKSLVHGQLDQSEKETSIELLSVLLESAIGSCPVFQLMHPGKFFSWIQRLLCVADTERLRDGVDRLAQVASRIVIGDAHVVDGVGEFIQTLGDEMTTSVQHLDEKKVKPATMADKARFSVASHLLLSIVKQMKKSKQTSGVRSACEKYFSVLSTVFTSVLSKMRVRQGETTQLTPSHPIIHGFSSILQHCAVSTDSKFLSVENLTDAHFVLDFAIGHVQTTTFEDYKMDVVCLELIKTVCRCRGNIPAVCTHKIFVKIWSALIQMMKVLKKNQLKAMMSSKCVDNRQRKMMTSQTESGDVTSKVMTSQTESGDVTVADMLSLTRETTNVEDKHLKITDELNSDKDEFIDFKTDQWKTRMSVLQNTITIAILSCDTEQFKSFLTNLVNDMNACCVWENRETIVTAVDIWSRLLSSGLSEGQGCEIAHICQHVIMNYQEVMRVIDGTQEEDVVHHLAVPVLTTQAQMIQFGSILMSSQLAMECLHSCLLMPLEGVSYDTFIPAFQAVSSVLNALMMNHADLMLETIPSFVAVATRLMKVLIVYGSQSKLKSESSHVTEVVQCAHLLTKLLQLMASHGVEFGKVSVYMLADYTSEVQKTTLLPVVKKAMLPGIYSIVGLCDDYGVAHLHTALPVGVGDVFHMLYTDYKQYFKYSGRI